MLKQVLCKAVISEALLHEAKVLDKCSLLNERRPWKIWQKQHVSVPPFHSKRSMSRYLASNHQNFYFLVENLENESYFVSANPINCRNIDNLF